MDNENQILKYFKNQNNKKIETKPINLAKSFTQNDGEPDTGKISLDNIKYKETTISGNLNSKNGVEGIFKVNTLKKNLNKKSDTEIDNEIKTRGSGFYEATKNAMKETTNLVKDLNNYDESNGISPGNINLTTYGDHGYYVKDLNNKISNSLSENNSFISNQVEYDKSGDIKSIGNNIVDRAKTKLSGSLTSSFESSVSSLLGNLGLGITSSDYPFQGRGAMFGSLAFDPGSTSKYAIVIEEPDDSICEADAISLPVNNKITVSKDKHSVTDGSNILSQFASSFVNSITGGSYPTCSPYKDIFPSGWVPCTGFSLDYGRILTEGLGITQEYQFELPTSGIIAPALTTEILEDNQQSVRRWLKDYMEFISPYPGFVRPYTTCCCKITVLTYNKQWSRDAGDVSDAVMNLVGLGNSQNKSSNFLKWVFYAYPTANVSYQSSPEMNIDSVTISWNVVGEKNEKINAIGSLINKFL